MPTQPVDFEQVPIDEFEPCSCSPTVEWGTEALAIRVPSRITSPFTRFPLCGAYVVSARTINRFRSFSHEIVLVAVNGGTHQPCACNLVRPGFEPEREHYDETVAGWDSSESRGWFNVDLFARMPALQKAPARHYVFATVGTLVSNVCLVELGGR